MVAATLSWCALVFMLARCSPRRRLGDSHAAITDATVSAGASARGWEAQLGSVSIFHCLFVCVAFASPIMGVIRGVKNSSILHTLLLVFIPAYGLVYFFKREGVPDLQKELLIISAILLSTTFVHAASVPRDENSIAIAIDACVKNNEADDVNQRLAPGAAREYCTCYSRVIVTLVNDQEYTALLSGNQTPSFREKVDQASNLCLKKLLTDHQAQTFEQRDTALRLEILTDSMRAKCPAAQRAALENANITDAQIATYCGCMAKHLTEALTTDEALAMAAGQISHGAQIKLNALKITCFEVMNGQTKDGPITPVR